MDDFAKKVPFKRLLFVWMLTMFLFARPAHADCVSPSGVEADMIYNSASHTYQFCNGAVWVSMNGLGASGAYNFISTQTASSSASLIFANLPPVNTVFLNCSGLLSSTDTGILVRTGTGAGPTWNTGAHYMVSELYISVADTGDGGVTNATDLTGNDTLSPSAPASFKMYLDNIASSSTYKAATWSMGTTGTDVANTFYVITGSGYWNNDKLPVTGIKIAPATGTLVSGQCSLYGLN